MITKVLLIDDDLDEHEIFSHVLRQHNRKISCVALACIESLFCYQLSSRRNIFRYEYA
jgi:hypothetical protein